MASVFDLTQFCACLERMETTLVDLTAKVDQLIQQHTIKECYSTEEFGELVKLAPTTVRGYCNEGRIIAQKRQDGHGNSFFWVIMHEELVRFRRYGLISKPKVSTKI